MQASLFRVGKRIKKRVMRVMADEFPRWLSHTRYTPFIILGQMRTGSNLLRYALQSSPHVILQDEIFNGKERRMGRDFDEIMVDLLRAYPLGVQAIGCKIFYSHLTAEEWVKFQALPNFKIIHLMRRNRLRTFLSLMIAQKTNRWLESRPNINAPIEQRQVWLDHKHLSAYFRISAAQEQIARQRFKDREVLEIYYEDMVTNFHQVVSEAIDFIGAKKWDSSQVALQKQNPEPMRDLILNFDELKNSFANTPWQVYFDETFQEPQNDTVSMLRFNAEVERNTSRCQRITQEQLPKD